MNKSDYDKYYKKGGTYVIPIEIFNELFDELERLNKARKTDIEYNKYLQKEIIRLNNIINELEKYIHNELILDFYDDNMPCELIINKMENMIKELKGSDKE